MSEELIKSLKDQLEMVIKENQRLLEKHFEQDSEIMYLIADYDSCKEENKKLHSIIKEAINKTNDIEFRITGKDFNYYLKLKDIEQGKELLEILDKVEVK